ncbi:MAG TPA: hypothetical protein VL382_01190 [Terriglobales bacterium]|nr:hypothetical protein [Terriglobales bacterium]
MKSLSKTHILQGRHALLVGRTRGLFLGVCLQCGALLGIARHLRLLAVVDEFHSCGPRVCGL